MVAVSLRRLLVVSANDEAGAKFFVVGKHQRYISVRETARFIRLGFLAISQTLCEGFEEGKRGKKAHRFCFMKGRPWCCRLLRYEIVIQKEELARSPCTSPWRTSTRFRKARLAYDNSSASFPVVPVAAEPAADHHASRFNLTDCYSPLASAPFASTFLSVSAAAAFYRHQ